MATGREKEGRNNGKGPKQRIQRHLGPRCVFFFIRAFFILISVLFYVYRFYSTKYTTEREMGRADDENRPKRLIQHRLGPRCVIFLIHDFFSYSLMFYFMYIGSTL